MLVMQHKWMIFNWHTHSLSHSVDHRNIHSRILDIKFRIPVHKINDHATNTNTHTHTPLSVAMNTFIILTRWNRSDQNKNLWNERGVGMRPVSGHHSFVAYRNRIGFCHRTVLIFASNRSIVHFIERPIPVCPSFSYFATNKRFTPIHSIRCIRLWIVSPHWSTVCLH